MANTKISEATLTVPTGTDKIPLARVGDTVARYATVQDVYDAGREGDSTFVNVKNYGAVGDGTTDDTAAIQAAIDAITGYWFTLHFPKGQYKVTSKLLFKWKINCVIRFDNAVIVHSGNGFAASAVFEITGCSYIRIYNMRISQATGDTNMCRAGLVLGRASSGFEGTGDVACYDMYIDGHYEWGALYMCCAEVCAFYSCQIYNKYSNSACLYIMGYDQGDLCELNTSSNTVGKFDNCAFWQLNASQAGNDVPIVVLAAYCSEFSFRDSWCYVASGKCVAFQLIEDGGSGQPGDIDASVYFLIIDRWRNESGTAGSRIVDIPASCSLSSLRIDDIKWPTENGSIVEVDGGMYFSRINPGVIAAKPMVVYALKVNNGGSVGYSRFVVFGDTADDTYTPIYVDTGGGFFSNQVNMMAGVCPISGGGTYEDGDPSIGYRYRNILLYNGHVKTDLIRRGYICDLAVLDATPSVAAGEHFLLNAAYTPAWDVTFFDDGVDGQIIYIHITGGTNVTLKADDAKLVMAGGIDWNPPSNSSITFMYQSFYDKWIELGRMVR